MKKIRTAGSTLIKNINKSIVFDAVRLNGPISRAQISKNKGLNKATVSKMISELIGESLVSEKGEGISNGGRKPIMLHFNNLAGFSIGIDLGVNYITGLLTDLNGFIIERINIPIQSTEINQVLNSLINVIKELKHNAPNSPYGIIGIGIGVPGRVDIEGNILFAPNLDWNNIKLSKKIESIFHVPVKIINEANAGAHGEHILGSGKDINNQIYISIGIGIGTGIIINQQLYEGTFGVSGEMGHFSIDVRGKKCSCGNRGCWELYASEKALVALAYDKNIIANENNIDLDYFLKRAKEKDVNVLQVLERLGENIGFGLVNVINILDPKTIIIGNRISKFETWINDSIQKVLYERIPNYNHSTADIRFSSLKEDAVALGVNLFAISDFLQEKQLNLTHFN